MDRFARALVLVLAAMLLAPLAEASDHADPIFLESNESNITGLFFFPHDDQYILILNVRRATQKGAPFNLSPYEYAINIDWHSAITFDDENRARYGGKVTNPEGISPDVSIKIHLNDDTTIKDHVITGMSDAGIRWWSGLRDDPFIFPRFFKRNVISMVMSVPKTSFPAGKQDWLLWATTSKGGKQIDIVGRSNRTQLGRFNFLNVLPPNQHVSAIMKEMQKQNRFLPFLQKYKLTTPLYNLFHMVLQIRPYDIAPDVMVFSTRYPPGFPNGRQLPDDIVLRTCMIGDCDLFELSYIEGTQFPRATVNDKPFLADFPFEADPWPDMAEKPGPVSFWRIGIWLLLLFLLIVVLWSWLWYRIGVRSCEKRVRVVI
jgi:hypothetical protein